MSALAIVSTALKSEIPSLEGRPEFRKATDLMKNCVGVSELCLQRLPEALRADLRRAEYQNMNTVLGTSLGEIEVTREFLQTLDQSGMARPILFQNSLHNAVIGFMTLTMGLKGPSITVSHRFMTAENALDTALLMGTEMLPFQLVVCGEIIVPDFMPGYAKIYPPQIQLKSGAAAMFLASKPMVEKFQLKPLAWLEGVEYRPMAREKLSSDPASYYDSNGLEELIDSGFAEKKLKLSKPNGSYSVIHLR